MSGVTPGAPRFDPPTGPPLPGPPPSPPVSGRGWPASWTIGLIVVAVGVTALITSAITANEEPDVAPTQELSVASSLGESDTDEPRLDDAADTDAAPTPIDSIAPTTGAVPAATSAPRPAPSVEPVDDAPLDPDGGAVDETDLQDLQAGADKLEDADDEDVLVLSLPAGGSDEPGTLQPLTATIRGDDVFLEGTAPSSKVGREYERQAMQIWGDKVVARYSIDARAPAPLADDVVLEKPVLFEPGSATIDPDYLPVLDACFEFLNTYPAVTMIVEGHTDDVGSDEYNLRLAQRRADAIVAYYESLGLTADRLVTVAAGEALPLADNETDEGREQNRRIDLSLVGALVAAADDSPADSADGPPDDGTDD